MRRGLALLLLVGLVQAQSLGLRFGFGEGLGLTLGASLETSLRTNLNGRLGLDLSPGAPGVALEALLLFKPDLGRYDPSLRGLAPYLGGGLGGMVGPKPTAGVTFALGFEGPIDFTTGLFLEGRYLYALPSLPHAWWLGLGATFR